MPIKLVRIDDRLIHGQVCTTWVKYCKIERVDIVDDSVDADPLQQTILKLTAPPRVDIYIHSVEKFTKVYKRGILKSAMLILTNPHDILKLIESGVKMEYVNVGGMQYQQGKRQITGSVSVSEGDLEAFRKIIQSGVRVEIQIVPTDKKTNMERYL